METNLPEPSIRRNLEQVMHCVREALSVVENGEPRASAVDDLDHAALLIKEVRKRLSP